MIYFRVQLIHLVETNLITNHIKEILGKGFEILVNENRLSSVGLIYDLFSRIGQSGVNELREAFGNYIKVIFRISRMSKLIWILTEIWSWACDRC